MNFGFSAIYWLNDKTGMTREWHCRIDSFLFFFHVYSCPVTVFWMNSISYIFDFDFWSRYWSLVQACFAKWELNVRLADLTCLTLFISRMMQLQSPEKRWRVMSTYNRPFNLNLDLWKSRSWKIKACSNLRKISGPGNLNFFSVDLNFFSLSTEFFSDLYHKPKKNPGDKLKKIQV